MKLLQEQLDYNHWAVKQYLYAVSELNDSQLVQNLNSSFASVLETFGHMLWVEELWYNRWQGKTFSKLFNSSDYPTLEFIKRQYEEIFSQQKSFIDNLESNSEHKKVSYLNSKNERWEYPLSQMVQHLMFHSAYHRGQLSTMLRQLGKVPPTTDYLVYIDSLSLD